MKAKSIDFVTTARQVIQIEEIGMVSILFINNNNIKLYIVTLALGYNSNLISLGQLREIGILYYNSLIAMTLMQ